MNVFLFSIDSVKATIQRGKTQIDCNCGTVADDDDQIEGAE
jgi:hypothetical protein